ncbi:hypothetical protein SAMN05192545_0336 [Maribacter dokdonensis]|uniref:Uncharacterized protein n=1 Tax=Maribacter dokdonensis TaxID=320912 RepID=A0ABY0U0T0_9FLAO|nr:hypothetical protein SAMN05192545_0336 [Maribacter dokdonensis]
MKFSKAKFPSTKNHQRKTINEKPSTKNHQRKTINEKPSTKNHQRKTINGQPSTDNHQRTTINYFLFFLGLQVIQKSESWLMPSMTLLCSFKRSSASFPKSVALKTCALTVFISSCSSLKIG